MRALIIDDSRAMRTILQKIMGEVGFEAVTAANGTEGLETLQGTDGIDLVLIDWNLPGMNGYEIACAVREMPRYNDVKLMMVTTETEIENVSKALDAGVNEYVMKPFTKETIQEKLALLGFEAVAGSDG
jgi:two-component system chemotaxis response regulator CheY